jgi:hypothetical protein
MLWRARGQGGAGAGEQQYDHGHRDQAAFHGDLEDQVANRRATR